MHKWAPVSRKCIKVKICGRSARKLCCPCGCPPEKPGVGKEIEPPAFCCITKIPPNPCCPRFHYGKDTWKKFKYLALFVGFPLIIFQTFNICGHTPPCKGECRDYEYMRRRFKKYPWRDGVKTFLHNDRVNHLPGECVPPPLDCD